VESDGDLSGPPAHLILEATDAGAFASLRRSSTPRAERYALGRRLRQQAPRSALGQWKPADGRTDPVDLVVATNQGRVERLVPVRVGRMSASPFAFLRGAAAMMAEDFAGLPATGILPVICGDAHLSNFGFYATPERQQAFDINDFDETHPGPFEWDVKRLAASVAVASLTGGFSGKKARTAAMATAAGYRREIRRLAPMGNLDVWYSHQDIGALLREIRRQVGTAAEQKLSANLAKARFRDSGDALRKLTVTVDGQVQIKNDPPLIMPAEQLLAAWNVAPEDWYHQIETLISSYRRTLQGDRRHLLDQFSFVQLGFKVVGVGSVGTRAFIVLLDGADAADPLFLQAKEAQRSVLADYVTPATRYTNQGERVVHGQRLTQMTSDIFLGWQRVKGVDGKQRDFYIRQLRDGKGSVVVEQLTPPAMAFYGDICGKTLARAHARSGDRVAIAAYLGGSDTFDSAIADYAMEYAARNELDHAALRQAAGDGRIIAREGI
jgi:uncharacterized protein (DUF2252 family)